MLLAVVRHAKALKDSPTGHDVDRALAARGLAQAQFLADRFASYSTRPDAIIASRAVRTRQTAHPIASACAVDFDLDDRLLVDRPPSQALALIQDHADSRFLVLVGHNPQVSDLCLTLTRGLASRPGSNPSSDSGQWDDLRDLSTGQAVILKAHAPDLIGRCTVLDIWRLLES